VVERNWAIGADLFYREARNMYKTLKLAMMLPLAIRGRECRGEGVFV